MNATYRKEVRRRFECLSAEQQEAAALRALRRPVFFWDYLTNKELDALLGAVVVVALLA